MVTDYRRLVWETKNALIKRSRADLFVSGGTQHDGSSGSWNRNFVFLFPFFLLFWSKKPKTKQEKTGLRRWHIQIPKLIPIPFETRDTCGRWHRSCEVTGLTRPQNPKGQNVYFLLCTKEKNYTVNNRDGGEGDIGSSTCLW